MTTADLAPFQPFLDANGCRPIDLENGLFKCPGRHWHTTPNAETDCKLFINDAGYFQLHCVHTSCHDSIAVVNSILAKRRGIAVGHAPLDKGAVLDANSKSKIDNDPPATIQKQDKSGGRESQSTPKEAGIRAELRRQRRMENALSDIIREFEWPYEQMVKDSRGGIDEPVHEHYYQAFCLFEDADFVWCGRDVQDTGSPAHASRFRPVRQWLAETTCPGSFICPSTFKQGVYSRSKEHVLRPKFLVVESDKIGKNEIGALFRWLKTSVGLRLRMVVDTAGKSLHGWFDYPHPRLLQQLEYFLPALGCDPALFNPSQPCRLPGAVRDGHHQKLIYIAD